VALDAVDHQLNIPHEYNLGVMQGAGRGRRIMNFKLSCLRGGRIRMGARGRVSPPRRSSVEETRIE